MGKINNRDSTHLFASISYMQIYFCCRNTQSNEGLGEELGNKFLVKCKKNGGIK